MLNSEAIVTLVTACGTGIGSTDDVGGFDADKCRYHKIIVMADADVDGSHIQTLLLTFFFRHMRELIDRGYVELGLEDTSLVRASDDFVFNKDQVSEIVEIFSKLEQLGNSVTRHGCPLSTYLDAHDPETYLLPKYVVRVRTGHSEEYKFLNDEAAKSAFYSENGISDDGFGGTVTRDVDLNGRTVRQRISVHEVYGANQMLELIKRLSGLGVDPTTFEQTNQPRYFLQEELSDSEKSPERVPVYSGLEMVSKIRDIGRKGLSIQRYKGLGEMNADQLAETTMIPGKRRLLQVTIADAAAAESTFSMLMGEDVEIRRAFIEDNALNALYLDI